MAKEIIKDYAFTPGAASVGTIKVPGRVRLSDLLLITNSTRGTILFATGNATYAGTTSAFTAGNDATNFPTLVQKEDGYSTITLAVDTSTHNANDELQIFYENSRDGLKIRPYDFGTDAIERMRVSNPQSMIDADFEYGLQPTKWAGFGLVRGYPSAFELPGVDLTVTAITTDYQTLSTSHSLITVTFSTAHGLSVGGVVNVTGLNSGINGFSRAVGNFLIYSVPSSTTLTYFARGTVGSSPSQSLYTDETLVKRGALYSASSIVATNVTSNGANPSTITVTFANPHGLVAGTAIQTIVTGGTNPTLASGPFTALTIPTPTTLTYTARSPGAVTSPTGITVYAFSNSTIVHRPQDGGVLLNTRSPIHGVQVVRQTKKYFRYQSGKGVLFSTGTLLRPNYDIQSINASGLSAGSTITITTDGVDHGLQPGAEVRVEGVLTSGYNGTYTVNSVLTDYTFTVLATQTLGAATGVMDVESRVFVTGWKGSMVRLGMFDDQNGLFWEYDGRILSVVRRHSTQQITGTLNVTSNSGAITGTNTRFTQQLRAGNRIVIRGMTHFVSKIDSDTEMHVTPDYRGINASGVKGNIVTELRIPQDQFNGDTIDGNGPSGFNIDLSKMQMLAIQFSWYGAGFIDYMCRGHDGEWIMVHRIKNNNVNNEPYMRSGNLPVRYSIENDGPYTHLTAAVNTTQNTLPVAETRYFPTSGIVYVGNEQISYTGKSTQSGPGNLTGCERSATYSIYQGGTMIYLLAADSPQNHSANSGVIYMGNTCSPTLSHWGSALIMDGGFDEDRGYIFNYQRVGMSLTTSTQTAFVMRLAPSVENGQVGQLGSKDLLNRSQLLLQAVGIAISGGNTGVGAVVVEGVLNPKNFSSATWQSLNPESVGGQPSFSQVATSVTWTSGTYALPGEQVFAFTAPSGVGGCENDRLDLSKLKELTGAPLGGDYVYPDGSDILAINIRLTSGTAQGHILMSWSEAQA